MIVEFPLMFAFVMLTFQKGDYKTRQKPKDNKVSGTYQDAVLFEIILGQRTIKYFETTKQLKAGIVGFPMRRRYFHSEKCELNKIEEVQIIQVGQFIGSLMKKARSLELK